MSAAISTSDLPILLDERACERRVGLILLATDQSTEADFCRMVASDRINVFGTRIEFANPTTTDNLRAMKPRLAAAASLLLPGEDFDVICFSCTSGSVLIGDAEIAAAIHASKPGAAVVTPPAAAAMALRALNAQKISVLTPYVVPVGELMADYFLEAGFTLENFTCLEIEDDGDMARMSRASLVEAAVAATAPSAEALFISCTALRSAAAVPEIEARIGRPVVTSNLATVWACLGHCGALTARPDAGGLMALPLPAAA
ncbi:ectoine utilization protein EutA [Aurantimonas sp. A2-1-M11]|uniref:ectoine utilization protein EutA n=1 Tax=Aurantimonas sp. A2-1-M11 TaxID=3113712 RepID=UPI002F945DB4